MRDVFKGWRRKAGCIALLAAIAFAILWARTAVVADHLGLNFVAIESFRGGICWIFCYPCEWEWQTFTEEELRSNIGDLSLPEAIAEELSSASEADIVYGYILYWWLVAPLIIFSAYLILWKPRTRPKGAPDA